jgi:4-alpha-glucanotransferase
MHVGVFDLQSQPEAPLSPRAGSVAFVDTHDTATFAGWCAGSDISAGERAGYLTVEQARGETSKRRRVVELVTGRLAREGLVSEDDKSEPTALHSALLEELGRSAAGLVSVNIEDLWGEPDPQNVPGPSQTHRNFARRLRFSLHELEESPALTAPLRRLSDARRQLEEGTQDA